MLIQPEPEEEEEDMNAETQQSGAEDSGAERPASAGEDGKKEEAKEAKADDKKKGAKPAAKGKKDAKKVEEVAAEVPDENAKPDPNVNKFCPDIIRLSRPHCNSVHSFQ